MPYSDSICYVYIYIYMNIYLIWAAAFIYDVAAVKKIHGVPPPRFNLVFQVSALFHHEWSRFHHEWPRFNIVLKCFKPTSFLESPHLVLISFCRRNQHFHKPCLTPHLVFIIVNKCSCSYRYHYKLYVRICMDIISDLDNCRLVYLVDFPHF